jgi:L-iditol 2-dehydrogenase
MLRKERIVLDTKMKAIVLRGPNQYGLELVDIPKPGYKEVLVRIKSVAICGSDPAVLACKGYFLPELPFIPGHEFSGEVVALGDGVTELKVGDRVAGEAHCGCGYCKNCKAGNYNLCLNYGNVEKGHRHYGFTYNGCYAQYNAYNVKSLTKIPDNLSFDAAALCDAAGTSYQAVNIPGVTPGGYSVTIGPGPIGIFAMQIAKAKGSRTIIVGRRQRLQVAKDFGADYIIDYEKTPDVVKAIFEITNGLGADEVFECAGTETAFIQAINCVKKGGRVSFVGIPKLESAQIPLKTVILNQITLYGVRANPNITENVVSMFANRIVKAEKMITHRFPIDDFDNALNTFVNRIDGALKVIINP